MLYVDSSHLCMSGLSLCDLCLCCSIFGSQFSNKYLLTYLPHLQSSKRLNSDILKLGSDINVMTSV